jgi:hypothetical protein
MISLPEPEEVISEFINKISYIINEVKQMQLESGLKEYQISRIDIILKDFVVSSRYMLNCWLYKFEEEHGTHPEGQYVISTENIEEILKNSKEEWEKSAGKIEEIGKMLVTIETTATRKLIQKAYELIMTSLVDFQKTQILSEEEVSHFLTTEIDKQLISGYATSKFIHFDPSTENAYVSLNMKQSLEASNSIDGFPYILKCKCKILLIF